MKRLLLCAALGACSTPSSKEGTVVGVLLDYTGNDAANGFNLERGVLLAADLMEQARSGDQTPFRLVFRDSRGRREDAEAQVQALVDEGAVAVIGPTGDASVPAVAPALDAAGTLLFSPLATAGSSNPDALWFRMTPGNASGSSAATLYGANLATELQARGIVHVGVVADDNPYNQDLATAFIETHLRLGGSIEAHYEVGSGLNPAVASNPSFRDPAIEAFLVALNLLPAATLVTDVASVTTPPRWLFSPRVKSDVFLQNTPSTAIEGAIGISPNIELLHQTCEAGDTCFADEFEKAWGEAPFEETYFAYDTAALLLIALDQVMRQNDGEVSREALAAALLEIAAIGGPQVSWNDFKTALAQSAAGDLMQYRGLTGPILFSANGSRRSGKTSTWTISNGQFADDEATTEP